MLKIYLVQYLPKRLNFIFIFPCFSVTLNSGVIIHISLYSSIIKGHFGGNCFTISPFIPFYLTQKTVFMLITTERALCN